MNIRSRLNRLERQHRGTACPLCAHGYGMRRVVVVEDADPPAAELYACPVCHAEPEQVRVVRIDLGDGADLTPHQAQEREERRAVLRFLAHGPADSPRAKAIARLKTRHESGRDAAQAATTTSRRTSCKSR